MIYEVDNSWVSRYGGTLLESKNHIKSNINFYNCIENNYIFTFIILTLEKSN